MSNMDKLEDKVYVLWDIDGTLANLEHRLHYIKDKPADWNKFHTECVNDEPYHDMFRILRIMNAGCGGFIRFLSGRNAMVRKETIKWLAEHMGVTEEFVDKRLLMRSEGDRRPDTVIKKEMVTKQGLTPENVLCIFDDRQSVVDMWRDNGFRCLQVQAWTE